MAGHWRFRPNANINVCSIDTLYSRKLTPKANLIIIDEAHHATSQGYHWLVENYPDALILAVTATPYVNKSLRHVADTIVKPITMRELIAQGFLVPPKYYAPSIPDLTGVRVSSGDFVAEDLDKILNKSQQIGDVVDAWKKLGQNRPTLMFAATIKHSLALVEAFNNAGIATKHVDADNTDKEREEAISDLQCGKLKIISNVGILNVGVDIPFLGCIVSVRPTRSYSLYVQVLGRGTRPYEGKSDFIVLDHGGNVLRHGCILEEREGSLDPIPKAKKGIAGPPIKTCKACYAIYSVLAKACPSCNAINEEKVEREIKKLEAKIESCDPFHLQVIAKRGELRDIAKRKGFKRGWVYYKLVELYGRDVAKKYETYKEPPSWVERSTSKTRP